MLECLLENLYTLQCFYWEILIIVFHTGHNIFQIEIRFILGLFHYN